MKEEGWMGSSAMLRKADFERWLSVVAGFMQSNIACEYSRPLRWAKPYPWKFLAAVFSGAALPVASVGIEDEDGAVFAGNL
jgi:hypothetical protein